MKHFTRLLSALALAFILALLVSMPVYAQIAQPTSGPTIEKVDIYRHCLEDDDMLIVVQYYLNYDTDGNPATDDNPEETIHQAYLGRLMSASNVELANVQPYAYYDKGYSHGIFSMYLTASEASGHWNTVCTVKFEGNPTLSWTGGPPPPAVTTTLVWHSATTSQATRILLSNDLIPIANTLSDYWSIALTTETASGTLLSTYGEQYFAQAIVNVRTMCPDIFTGAVVAPEYTPVVHEQAYRDTLLNRWEGTMPGRALSNLAEWTTIPLTVVKGFLWFIPVGFIAYFLAIASKDTRPALFLILLTLPMGNLLGMLSLTVTILAALACVLAIGYALFYKPASG